jgi:hypothetical protein
VQLVQERAHLIGLQHDGQTLGAICAGGFANPPDVQAGQPIIVAGAARQPRATIWVAGPSPDP